MEIHKIILQILVPHQEWPNKQNQTEIVIQININLIQNVMKSLKKLFTLLLISGIAFTSCDGVIDPIALNPQDAEELKNDAIQNAKADETAGGALQIISSYGISEDWSKKSDENDPIVEYDPTTFIVTITYSYGGFIKIDWDKEPTWNAVDLKGVVDINNINQNNAALNAEGMLIEKGGTITESTLHINGTGTITIQNAVTTMEMDRVFETYSSQGENPAGEGFAIWGTSTLTYGNKTTKTKILEAEKLIQYLSCAYPQQGISYLEIVGTNKSITTDYGIDENGVSNNKCDPWVNLTLKIGGATITVKIDLSK